MLQSPLQILRRKIKRSIFWRIVIQSDLYRRIKFPDSYRNCKRELEFYRKVLGLRKKKTKLIFDVGANMGRKSFIFSKLAEQVIAFEPGPRLYRFLIKRFKGSNIVLINCALGKESSVKNLFIIEQNQAYNSLSKKHIETTVASRGVSNATPLEQVQVRVEPLEKYIQTFGVPDYLKIDVEGYEYQVLQGLLTPVPVLSFEVNLPDFKEESLLSIRHLERISGGRYHFNYCNGHDFRKRVFISGTEMNEILRTTTLDYMEVFAKLNDR